MDTFKKEDFDWYKSQYEHRLRMDDAIRNGNARYVIQEIKESFLVVASILGNRRIVKSYSKGCTYDSNNLAYEKAEKLCEILNRIDGNA